MTFSDLLTPTNLTYAWKLGALALGVLASRGIIKNARAARMAMLLSVSEHAWGAVETWKKASKVPLTASDMETQFFVEMGRVLYNRKAGLLNQVETLALRGWVKVRSASENRSKKAVS